MLRNSSVHRSKLFQILRSLNKKEAKEFNLWLVSPLHNNSKELALLYKGIRSTYRKLDRPVKKRELLGFIGLKTEDSIFLSPQEEKLLRDAMHQLTLQVQEYLLWSKTREDPFANKRKMMDIFMERKLYKYLPGMLKKTRKELEASPLRDLFYCDHAFNLSEMTFYMNVIHNNRSLKNDLQTLINKLRQVSMAQLLKYYCSAVSHEKVLQVKYDYPLMNAIREQVENSPDGATPAVRVYYTLLKLLQEGKSTYFYELKDYLFANSTAFNPTEFRQFFNHISNYCNWMIKQGKKEFSREQHEVFKKGLELKCWSTGIHFSTYQFIHIVKNALRLNEVDWVKNFLGNYKSILSPDARENVPIYCLSLLAFHQKDFDHAQACLMRVKFSDDFSYHLEFRVLLIRIYYELADDNLDVHPINSELEAMRQNVSKRNKKMAEPLRQAYNNFVNVFKRILERKKKHIDGLSFNLERVTKLQHDIPQIKLLVEREWLGEKLAELHKNCS